MPDQLFLTLVECLNSHCVVSYLPFTDLYSLSYSSRVWRITVEGEFVIRKETTAFQQWVRRRLRRGVSVQRIRYHVAYKLSILVHSGPEGTPAHAFQQTLNLYPERSLYLGTGRDLAGASGE